ncbi:MAG: TetR/AcrR family transcriptional regulator [Candidatus Heimdallarchaeaceae archaeon]
MNRKVSKKEKILNAALKIIAEKGNLDFTIREVVLDADVNIASVNYYFGTKKKLIKEIEKKYFEKLFEIQKILKDTQIKPKKRLEKWLNTLFEYMFNNPGLISILSSKLFITETFDSALELFLQENNRYLAQIIGEITNIGEKILKFKLAQIDASLFFPLILAKNIEDLFGFSFNNQETRKEYVRSIIDSIGIN